MVYLYCSVYLFILNVCISSLLLKRLINEVKLNIYLFYYILLGGKKQKTLNTIGKNSRTLSEGGKNQKPLNTIGDNGGTSSESGKNQKPLNTIGDNGGTLSEGGKNQKPLNTIGDNMEPCLKVVRIRNR